MKALKFYKLCLVLNIFGYALPVLLYLDMHGMDPTIIENFSYSVFVATVMFYWNKYKKNDSSIAALERPDTVMDGTPVEKHMAIVILLFPIIFGAIVFTAIAYFENGFAQAEWMLISLSLGIGIHLEATLRLSRSE